MWKSPITAVAATLFVLTTLLLCRPSLSFVISPTFEKRSGPKLELSRDDCEESVVASRTAARVRSSSSDRRGFFLDTTKTACATALGGAFAATVLPERAAAIPGVTVAEFEILVRDSAKSIKTVVFTGPKGETAVVTLADDTQFGITDLIESSSDPRSPLKLVATCRLNNVPTKFSALEDAVKSASEGSRKTKVYMNKRIQRADMLNKEKKIRMAQDELDRLDELEAIRQSSN